MDFKVMTFNIRCSHANDGPNNWPYRKDALIETIKDASPDILGVQEALPDQVEFLRANLPEYTMVGRAREADGSGENCALLIRTELAKVSQSGTFWLSENPNEPGSGSWNTACVRVATWAILDIPSLQTPFMVVNTHLDHVSEEARCKGSALIVDFIKGKALPALLMGDMNAEPGSDPIVYLSSNLQDAWSMVHPGITNPKTFHAFEEPMAAIDYIFTTSNVKVTSCEAIFTKPGGRWPSDHCPVLASINI